MRLTLRTLLAYMDDRLSPANARELGQKVAKSPFSLELADRIKDVVRRRRLATEVPNQKLIDANLIAEYLDDQLTPELVALIEKEILSSDHSLAEVAAAHQILGVLTDPVDISEGLQKRLQAMDPSADHDAVAVEETADATTATEWQPLTPRVEPQKRSPMLLLGVMVLAWFVLLASDSSLFSVPQPTADVPAAEKGAGNGVGAGAELPQGAANQANADRGQQDQIQDPLADPLAPSPNGPQDQNGIVPASRTGADPVGHVAAATPATPAAVSREIPNATDVAMQNPIVGSVAPQPTLVPAAAPSGEKIAAADSSQQQSPQPGTPARPALPGTARPAVSAAQLPVAQPARAGEIIHVTDQHSMLLLRRPDTGAWAWASSHGPAPGTNWRGTLNTQVAGIAEPYSARLDLPESGWTAELPGPSLFRTAPVNPQGIELLEGRMIVRRAKDSVEKDGVDVAVTAGGRSFFIHIAAADARTGIQMTPAMGTEKTSDLSGDAVESLTPETLPLQAGGQLSIFAAEGDITVRCAESEQIITVPRGSLLRWFTTSNQPEETVTAAAMPEWIFSGAAPAAEATATLLTELAAGLRKSESLSGAVGTMSTDRNAQIAAYAVKVASVTHNIDDLTALLLQSEQETVRREAIAGLQHIIRQSPVGADVVAEAMEKRLGEMELDTAMKLLAGVSRTAAEDRETCAWLVTSLDSKRVALRELAIYNLEQLTGDRNGYFAGDDSGRRDGALRRWKRLLERNDGKLLTSP